MLFAAFLRPFIIILSAIHFLCYYFKLIPSLALYFWFIQALLCFLYFFALYFEIKQTTEVSEIQLRKFEYLPPIVWFRVLILVSFFFIYGIFLILMGGRLKYLVPLVWMIPLGELIVFLFKKWSKQYYIMFFANYIDIHLGRKQPLFSGEILKMELVREVIYIFTKRKKIKEIRLFYFSESEKNDFLDKIVTWSINNNIPFLKKEY
ncbi:MAG: hypothetical protein N3F09_02460 [Bacteroidia bacterium]|nr:hypothetical protein [Bacteroidia bacterium]